MNRRRAILRILLLGGGAFTLGVVAKTVSIFQSPDLGFLDRNQQLIDELAELIIPRTDTPGAKDAKTGRVITCLVRNCTEVRSQNNFVRGLKELIEYAQSNFGKPFLKCTMLEQVEIMTYFDQQLSNSNEFARKVKVKLLGDSFMITLKGYAAIGYCTSEIGANQGLNYDYIPTEYLQIDLVDGQKAWATR